MDKLLQESLTRYFNILSKLGYHKYEDVYKLIFLLFITDFLKSECKEFITKKDYDDIDEILYCLFGTTCLIPFPDFIREADISCSGKSK